VLIDSNVKYQTMLLPSCRILTGITAKYFILRK